MSGPYKVAYLTTDPTERKGIPICTGVLDYFPLAIAEIAKVSKAGNDQHNPGQPLHWARGKSMDQADTTIRHLLERGGLDVDGHRHTAKAAWRVLAMLQIELEEASGLPVSRGSSEPEKPAHAVCAPGEPIFYSDYATHEGEVPVSYTTHEGGGWQRWPTDGSRFGWFAVRYANDDVWDHSVGWRVALDSARHGR